MGDLRRLEVLAQRPNLYLGSLGAVLLQSYRHRVTLDDVHAGHHVTARMTTRPGGNGRFAIFAVGTVDITLPDDAARRAATESMAKFGAKQLRNASVIEGSGFLASAARAAVGGMFLLSRGTGPQRVFSTIDEGAAWLATCAELGELNARALAAAMRELRAAHGVSPAGG